MRKTIFTFILALVTSVGTMTAKIIERVNIGDLYYNLDSETKTAEVTSQNANYPFWSTAITTVIIPKSVTYESVPYSVTSIGDYAFSDCSGLTSVTIGNSVTSIGEQAFSFCSVLTSVTIGNSVKSIGKHAFWCCYALTSVTIPNSVTSIGDYAFSMVANVVYYGPASGSPWGARSANGYVDGFLVYSDASKTNLLACSAAATGELSIPNCVTSIGENAFLACSSLTSVIIPNSVTNIGEDAFSSCSGLTSVTIGNSVTSIGAGAFKGCTSLTAVTLNSNTIVGSTYSSTDNIGSIFGSQVKEYILGKDVTGIGGFAFINCTEITSITIPENIQSMGKYSFYGCNGLQSVVWNAINCTTYDDGEYSYPPFAGCPNIASFTIGNKVKTLPIGLCYWLPINSVKIPNSVTSIGDYAFSDCSGLTSVTIGNSVTSIGAGAFKGCTGLTSIIIPESIQSMGKYSFSGCDNLQSVIWNAIKCDAYGPFQNCPNIASFTIGNKVKTLPNRLCSELPITSIEIPNSVTSIGNEAFYDCVGLTNVTIGNSVTSIGWWAFRSCKGLKSVTIPNSVTSIGDGAFQYCSSLTAVTIPNSVTNIGSSAFSGCSGLTSVTIPNSVTSIGDGAFSMVPNIVYSGEATGSPWGARCVNGYVDGYFVYSDDTKTNLLACSSVATGEMTIPNSVTSIGGRAFRSCKGLTSVTIPNSVTSIGDEAFDSCYGLTSITIPNSITSFGERAFNSCSSLTSVTIGNGITIIGDGAFQYCSSLTAVTIPNSVTSIGDEAFGSCRALTSVTIPNSVKSIGFCAFYGCDGLTNITIPNSVTSIGVGAFCGCHALTSVTIPNSVTNIGNAAFSSCTSLTSVTIGNSVTSIGNGAFASCYSLTSVTIPNSVTSIGERAFDGCSGLTSITSEAIIPPKCLEYYVFSGVNKSIPLYVPAGSVDAYKAAYQWEDFTKIKPIQAAESTVTEIEAEPTDNSVVIEWPEVTGATVYIIKILKDDELICTLSFNEQGQLLTISFNKKVRKKASQSATQTNTGWQYTIRDLEPGTEYTYKVVAMNGETEIYNKEKLFKTTGGDMAIDEISTANSQLSTKIVRDGVLYILRDGELYNAQGARVE